VPVLGTSREPTFDLSGLSVRVVYLVELPVSGLVLLSLDRILSIYLHKIDWVDRSQT